MKQAKTVNEPLLLVDDHHGIYVIQFFCQQYSHLMTNKDELKEDVEICLSGPDHEFYHEAWESILFNAELLYEGKKYTVGNLYESGDLWAIPEGFIYDEY